VTDKTTDNLKITLHLDGTGVMWDPSEPIHLDALLAWVLAPYHTTQHHITRDDVPEPVPLPLMWAEIGGVRVWRASALLPEGQTAESLRFWRKRYRVGRAELTSGSPNLTNGTYRDWQMPIHLTLCHRMVAYALGNRREVLKCLRRLPSLGKKRAHGLGKIVSVDVERVEHDWSLTRDGVAMRWLPDETGTRLVRPMPPYWNRHGRVTCCEVGAILTDRIPG
jgi:hypothetical protein